MDFARIDRIRERAYSLWEDAGRPFGKDREHWLQAEAEIENEKGADGKKSAATGARRGGDRKSGALTEAAGNPAGKKANGRRRASTRTSPARKKA